MREELALAKPTRSQRRWHGLERGAFFHFNMSTFVPEYDPWETPPADPPDPAAFDPGAVDVDQWLRAAAAFDAEYAVLTAKHHEGFCLWPTATHEYDVTASPYGGRDADLVGEFVDACRRHGVEPGIYLSGWSTYTGTRPGGVVAEWSDLSQAEYDEVFLGQLEELVTEYGDLAELWFDGSLDPEAGPDPRPVIYDHQPDAAVFQSPAGTVRWVGNERGHAPYPFWNAITHEDARSFESGQAFDERETGTPHGSATGPIWLPGECDTTVRDHHWFWKPDTESSLKSLDELLEVYYRSVGRGCNLLLNANPNREGVVPDPDLERYREFGAELDRRFDDPVASVAGERGNATLAFDSPRTVDHAVVMEDVRDGQRIRQYAVEARRDGEWDPVASGSSVGYRKIDRFEPVETDALRVRPTEAFARPVRIRRFAAYRAGTGPD